jgi:hypothetical protein
MAAVPDKTIDYLESLDSGHLGSPSVIFALGTCARQSPRATEALLGHARQLLEVLPARFWRSLDWVAIQLKRARHDSDPSLRAGLEDLILSVQQCSIPEDADSLVAKLQAVRQSWNRGTRKIDPSSLLKRLAEKYEAYPEVDEKDAFDLKYALERGSRPAGVADLSSTEREVLVQVMQQTAMRSTWTSSATWLVGEYQHFEGEGRLVVQDTLGEVARLERGVVETKLFARIREFYENIVRDGSPAEKQRAAEWLDRLVAEKLPGTG